MVDITLTLLVQVAMALVKKYVVFVVGMGKLHVQVVTVEEKDSVLQ